MIEFTEKRPWNIFTLGNAITAMRLVFGTFSVWLYMNQKSYWALFFYLLAAVTDFFDGHVARWRHSKNGNGISRFGEIFDPICDKLLIIPGIVIRPVLVAVVVLEGFSFFFSCYVRKKKGFHFISKWSKISTFVQLPMVALLFLATTSLQLNLLVLIIFLCSGTRMCSYAIEAKKISGDD